MQWGISLTHPIVNFPLHLKLENKGRETRVLHLNVQEMLNVNRALKNHHENLKPILMGLSKITMKNLKSIFNETLKNHREKS